MTTCPRCGHAAAKPLMDAVSELLAVLPLVPTQADDVEQQLTDAVERCRNELYLAQHHQEGQP